MFDKPDKGVAKIEQSSPGALSWTEELRRVAMAVSKKYGVKTKADDAQNRHIFASVRNLAAFVAEQRAAGAAG